QPEMRCRVRFHIATDSMLPKYEAAAQHTRVDTERVAYSVEIKCMRRDLAGHHDPALRVEVEQALAGSARDRALLENVYRVGEQGQHQALLGGQAMAAGNVEILGGEDLMETDYRLHDHIRGSTKLSHCDPH